MQPMATMVLSISMTKILLNLLIQVHHHLRLVMIVIETNLESYGKTLWMEVQLIKKEFKIGFMEVIIFVHLYSSAFTVLCAVVLHPQETSN